MKLQHLPALQRHFGTGWLVRRALYAAKLRSGVIRRRMPITTWSDAPGLFLGDKGRPISAEAFHAQRCAHPQPFFFSSADRASYSPLLKSWDTEAHNPLQEADRATRGTFRFFEHHEVDCGLPPDWNRNAWTKASAPNERHWSEIADFGYGDIKAIWEPNRFGFAYALVRAYWRSGDEQYPELFWQLVEDWRESNPPQRGPNWKCGQEGTFRAMAWCFGLYGFWASPATTPKRVFELAHMLGITAQRIAANIDYAIAQANNHGISEAVGLWTIGLLFPEFAAAEAWRDQGRAVLELQARELIYDDGAFSQHSVNYHRVMLHDYVWAIRLAELHGEDFTTGLRERIARAGEFLFQVQDDTTGAVPYYGQNDGALVLPLNNCGYHDFRPVVGSTFYLTHQRRLFNDGPWSEDLLWLFGRDAVTAALETKQREDLRADVGGYYTLRSPDGFAFTRATRFRHRPGQADMLHVDLWWRGQNIAMDAGTFSYNSAETWADAFAGTAAHNTVTVDGRDQMDRAGKFLWLPWMNGRVDRVLRDGTLAYLEAQHDGYARLESAVAHRRGIVQWDDTWLVLDQLRSDGPHHYRMHWLVADVPHDYDLQSSSLAMHTPAGEYHVTVGNVAARPDVSLVRADPETARGWVAPYYNHREPALSLVAEHEANSTMFWTLFSPEACRVAWESHSICISRGDAVLEIALPEVSPNAPLVSRMATGERHLNVPS